MRKPGDIVTVYHDPYDETDPEAQARLEHKVTEFGAIENWKVTILSWENPNCLGAIHNRVDTWRNIKKEDAKDGDGQTERVLHPLRRSNGKGRQFRGLAFCK